jgi:hypothetical protein
MMPRIPVGAGNSFSHTIAIINVKTGVMESKGTVLDRVPCFSDVRKIICVEKVISPIMIKPMRECTVIISCGQKIKRSGKARIEDIIQTALLI